MVGGGGKNNQELALTSAGPYLWQHFCIRLQQTKDVWAGRGNVSAAGKCEKKKEEKRRERREEKRREEERKGRGRGEERRGEKRREEKTVFQRASVKIPVTWCSVILMNENSNRNRQNDLKMN